MPLCPRCRGNHSPDVPCSALHEEHLRELGLKPVARKRKYSKEDMSWNRTALRILLIFGVLMFLGAVTIAILY